MTSANTPEPLPARAPVVTSDEDADRLASAWLLGYGNRNTRAAYRRDLAGFAAFLSAVDVRPFDATRAHVDAYARQLESSGARPATVARRLAAVSSFYAYALDEGRVAKNPVDRVRRPKVGDDSSTNGLDREELARLIAAGEASSARDHLLMLLLAVNGLRVSETCALDVDHVGTTRGHRTLRLHGKGGSESTAPLPPVTSAALDLCVGDRTSGPLLLDARGDRMDRHDVARVVRRLARAAGIEKRLSPHSLRHAAITAALDAGVSLRDVQDFARHADPRLTRRYDRGRNSLDRHASYAVSAWLAGAGEGDG